MTTQQKRSKTDGIIRYKHQRLRDYLLNRIRDGIYKPGEKIETEQVFCEKFNVSRNTVRQAVRELENAGCLRRTRGSGTYVMQKCTDNIRRIAFLVYDTAYVNYSITMDVLRGIDSVLRERGYGIDILEVRNGFSKEQIAGFARKYAGILVGAYQISLETLVWLEETSLPCVMVKNFPEERRDSAFRIDFEAGGFFLAKHLIGTGRGNFALVYPGEEIAISRDFRAGVQRACLEYGARLKAENIFYSPYPETASAPEVARHLASMRERPDAVICATDDFACELCLHLAENNLKVPKDIAVSGCNNSKLSRYLNPPLTTLELPGFELGKAAAEAVVSDRDKKNVVLKPTLVVRESTAGNAK